MRNKLRNILQIGAVLVFVALLVRFFPFVIAFLEGAAMSIRRFWWVVLIIALSLWSYWVLKKRNPL